MTTYDNNGCPSIPYLVNIPVLNTPSGNLFTYSVNGLTANFFSNFTGNHWWEFGDSTASFFENPSHSYTTAGWYNVLHIVNNDCGSDTLYQMIQVGNTTVHQLSANNYLNIQVQPNPFDDYCWLYIDKLAEESFDLTIQDVQGKTIRTYTGIEQNQLKINKDDLGAAVYFYTVTCRNRHYTAKLIIH